MLSVGVTASSDSVTPAPKPARTVRGPDSLPFSSASKLLNWSKATNPRSYISPLSPDSMSQVQHLAYGFRPWPSCQ